MLSRILISKPVIPTMRQRAASVATAAFAGVIQGAATGALIAWKCYRDITFRDNFLSMMVYTFPPLYGKLPLRFRSWKVSVALVDTATNNDSLMKQIPNEHLSILIYSRALCRANDYLKINSTELAERLVRHDPCVRTMIPPSLRTAEIRQVFIDKFLETNNLNDLEGCVFTGQHFNELMRDSERIRGEPRQFIKRTKESEIHHCYQFHDGLNVDTWPFDPDCSRSDFYFYEVGKENAAEALNLLWYRDVKIPDTAIVQVRRGKVRATEIDLGPRRTTEYELYQHREFI